MASPREVSLMAETGLGDPSRQAAETTAQEEARRPTTPASNTVNTTVDITGFAT